MHHELFDAVTVLAERLVDQATLDEGLRDDLRALAGAVLMATERPPHSLTPKLKPQALDQPKPSEPGARVRPTSRSKGGGDRSQNNRSADRPGRRGDQPLRGKMRRHDRRKSSKKRPTGTQLRIRAQGFEVDRCSRSRLTARVRGTRRTSGSCPGAPGGRVERQLVRLRGAFLPRAREADCQDGGGIRGQPACRSDPRTARGPTMKNWL